MQKYLKKKFREDKDKKGVARLCKGQDYAK